ncbi:MAG TPA: hypothetical protein VD967_03105 [Candidatus Paceibacterota bacterium]|nr:hypothetical protein [Candidatus Paceibacterota bacterium]
MNKALLVIGLVVIALGGWYGLTRVQEPIAPSDPEGALTHFIESVTGKVKTTLPDYDTQGLGGGVDGFALITVYPKLFPDDFIDVEAYQGGYSLKDGKVLFTGHAASNSAVIERKGMQTLLGNISKRLNIPADTVEGVDRILRKIEG